MRTEVSVSSPTEQFAKASAFGALFGLVCLPFEHPFDRIKTRWQASPDQFRTTWDIVRDIRNNEGLRGFYTGAVPNGLRMTVKQIYRWPLMFLLPPFFQNHLPKSFSDAAITKTLTGFTIASLESFIVCPLESYKVWQMTRPKEAPAGGDLRYFRGLNAVFARQITSWCTFLLADDVLKRVARKFTGGPLDLNHLVLIGIGVGIINTASNMPLDVVKTQLQKANNVENRGLWSTGKSIVKQHGFAALYTGWKLRIAQYLIQSTLFVIMSEKVKEAL
eukprot:TRINITY_DN8565_c0_g1_i1.p1 TRINITY_DN8565_c0_g1~~TRINITY_DN8565_c0_g1_i1.p1  ORF type:complete len:276 (+),score=46.46 TRINITY_DN8565_c0_g1_i1:92-919(+)